MTPSYQPIAITLQCGELRRINQVALLNLMRSQFLEMESMFASCFAVIISRCRSFIPLSTGCFGFAMWLSNVFADIVEFYCPPSVPMEG